MAAIRIARAVRCELIRAQKKFPPFNSYHEGYAVLREEVDELWDEIKGGQDPERLRDEATQVAAMAMRFLLELCPQHPDSVFEWEKSED